MGLTFKWEGDIDVAGKIIQDGKEIEAGGSSGKTISKIEYQPVLEGDIAGQPGATDTYLITYTDNSTDTFTVYNGKNGEKGDKGETGSDGYTPVKGTDYWTESDKTEIVNEVSSQTYLKSEIDTKFNSVNDDISANTEAINKNKTDILSVAEDFNRLVKENGNTSDLWEQGGIGEVGGEYSTTKQIRTKDYLPQNIKRIVANEGYTIRAVAYSTDGSFAGFWNGTSLQDAVVSLNSLNVYDLDGYYVRLVTYKGGAEIDVDDFVNIRFINDIYDRIEEVDEKVNRDIRQYSSENVIPTKDTAWESLGITITPNGEGRYTLTGGTPTTAGGTWIYNSEKVLPSNILKGNEYRVGKVIPKGCILNIRFYDGTSWSDTIQITATTPYAPVIVPENTTGLRVQFYFTSTANFDGVVVETEMISTSSIKYALDVVEGYHKKEVPPPLLTIIDDDGNQKFETLLLPIVQAKKVPISSAIIVGNVATTSYTMSWEQIENCALNGAEILSHTYTHLTDSASENMTEEEIAYDYRLAQSHLRKNGYKSEILIFAGASSLNDKNINACKQSYSYGFKAGTNKTNYKGKTDRYGIDRWEVAPTATYDDLKAMVDQLLSEGTGWMIWMTHANNEAFQQEFANTLSTVIDYAISQGLTIGTAEYGCKLYCD